VVVKVETPINVLLDKITSQDVVYLENETFVNNLDDDLIEWFSSNVRELPKDNVKYIVNPSIRFYKCKFKGDLNFSNFHFRDTVIIQESIFEGDLNFTDSFFEDGIFFIKNVVLGNASFFIAQFKEIAIFMGTKFEKDAIFNHAKFYPTANLSYVRFSDNRTCHTWFRNTTFHEDANFESSHFSQQTDLRVRHITGNLKLNDSTFDRLEIDYPHIKSHLDGNEPVYKALHKSLEDTGKFDDADDWLYTYRDKIRRAKCHSRNSWNIPTWSEVTDGVSCALCGYGTRPIYTVICIFIAVAIFFPIFLGRSESAWEAVYLSLASLTGNMPMELLDCGKWKYIVIFESFVGYFLSALLVVVLARKFIR
jgi:hypothetical protein